MANVSGFLQQMLNARYGKDVRQSIHDSINAINKQLEESDASALASAQAAQTAATEAKSAVNNIGTTVDEHIKKQTNIVTDDNFGEKANAYLPEYFGEEENADSLGLATNKKILPKLTNWYNATEYGLSVSNSSYDNGIALYKLLAIVESADGGTIYIPSGKYNIQNPNDYIIRTSNIRIIGDGASTILVRWSTKPLFRFVGVSKNISSGKQLSGIQLADLYLLSSQSYSANLLPVLEFEACTGIRINNLNLKGAGTHMSFIECFDSKIISTDFELSGRSYKATTDIADDSIDYADSANDDYTPTVMFKTGVVSYNQLGYETNGITVETTNQILFTNCRFESFYGGAVGLEGNGTNGIVFESCKFESMQSRVPFFVFRYYVSNFSWSNCFICKFTKTKTGGVDLSTIPIMFSDNLFLCNSIDVTVSIQIYDNTPMATDLFKLYQNSEKVFGSNKINIRTKSSGSNGVLLIKDGCYVVNAAIPHELYLNGNKTEVHNYYSYGGVNTEYEPLSPITTIPTEKWHKKGERLVFTEPDTEGKTEAICTVSGTPGTWILK